MARADAGQVHLSRLEARVRAMVDAGLVEECAGVAGQFGGRGPDSMLGRCTASVRERLGTREGVEAFVRDASAVQREWACDVVW